MTKSKLAAVVVFVLFLGWTIFLTRGYNYLTFFSPVLASGPGIQVLSDLTIAITMVMIFIYFDAKKTNRRFWPYAVIALLFGSFGPLLYFILKKDR